MAGFGGAWDRRWEDAWGEMGKKEGKGAVSVRSGGSRRSAGLVEKQNEGVSSSGGPERRAIGGAAGVVKGTERNAGLDPVLEAAVGDAAPLAQDCGATESGPGDDK
jgi:hypothetical protein